MFQKRSCIYIKNILRKFFAKFAFKQENTIDIVGENNHIFYIDSNGLAKEIFSNRKGINIYIRGNNNIIKFSDGNFVNTEMFVYSNNNKIEIKPSLIASPIILTLEVKNGDNQIIEIGNNFSCAARCEIWSHEENSYLIIGDNVMCSKNVSILTSDAHCVFDKSNNMLCNQRIGKMIIGSDVWLGKNAIVTKKGQIPDYTIVGAGAVVSKCFRENYTAIAGNPAKIIRRNVIWDRKFISHFIKEGVNNEN